MSAETETTLETTEAPSEEPSKLVHAYCAACLEGLFPERILPFCGINRPRNDADMTFQNVNEAPPEDLCVVCYHSWTCVRCGA